MLYDQRFNVIYAAFRTFQSLGSYPAGFSAGIGTIQNNHWENRGGCSRHCNPQIHLKWSCQGKNSKNKALSAKAEPFPLSVPLNTALFRRNLPLMSTLKPTLPEVPIFFPSPSHCSVGTWRSVGVQQRAVGIQGIYNPRSVGFLEENDPLIGHRYQKRPLLSSFTGRPFFPWQDHFK